MNAESFTLKARRTTRVPLRVPVQLSVEEGGAPKTLDGWTVIVNIHGAKIESKRRMQVGEVVKVTVPLTRKTQSGKVVWSHEQAAPNGNFEFAIELTEPGNLWGVGFPPSDWKEVKIAGGPVAVESKAAPPPAPAAPGPVSISAPSTATASASASLSDTHAKPAPPPVKKISVAGYQPAPIAPFAITKPAATASPATTASPAAKEPAPVAEHSAPAAPSAAAPEPPSGALLCPVDNVPAQHRKQPETPLLEMPMVAEPEAAPFAGDSPMPGQQLIESPGQRPAELAQTLPAVSAPLPLEQLFMGPAETVAPPETAALLTEMPLLETAETSMAEATNELVDSVLEVRLEPSAVARVDEPFVEAAAPLQTPAADAGQVLEIQIPVAEILPPPPASFLDPVPSGAAAGAAQEPAGRLAEIAEAGFQSKMESIIERACERACERAAAGAEVRLEQLRAEALERMDKKLSAATEDHYERLDQQSESLLASRRLEFEQTLAKFAEAADEAARTRQQEMISRAEQDLRRRSNEIALHAQGQVQRYSAEALESAQSSMAARIQDLLPAVEQLRQQAAEAVNAAQAGLRSKLEEMAPAIEQQITEHSRQKAEQFLYLQRGQFEAALSSRVEEARAYWQNQMESMQQDTERRVAQTMEKCMEQQGKVLVQQLDRALNQMAAQVQRTFFKHVVDELTSQQQVWMAQMERSMERMAGRGIQQVRQQMVQLLGAMGAALVQDDLPEAPEPSYSGSAADLRLNA